jgi:pimeloyl-ACP methyl ester carboxylesterase
MATQTTFDFTTSDGVRLVADRHGPSGAEPVLLLHGGGQTRFAWGGTARSLAEAGYAAITVDLRGHGQSDWAPEGDYRLSRFASDIGELVESLGREPVIIGASLGGLTTMLLVGEQRPDCAAGVVFVDVIPNMEQVGADRIANFMTERLADGFATLDEVADAVAAYNPHRPRPTDLSGLKKNLRERDGRWYWHWDPDFINGERSSGPSEITDVARLETCVEAITVPKLLVRGRMSDLVSEKRADEFVSRHADMGFVDVSDAGHMVAGDRNDAFTTAIVDFLRG